MSALVRASASHGPQLRSLSLSLLAQTLLEAHANGLALRLNVVRGRLIRPRLRRLAFPRRAVLASHRSRSRTHTRARWLLGWIRRTAPRVVGRELLIRHDQALSRLLLQFSRVLQAVFEEFKLGLEVAVPALLEDKLDLYAREVRRDASARYRLDDPGPTPGSDP